MYHKQVDVSVFFFFLRLFCFMDLIDSVYTWSLHVTSTWIMS